jgi:hypothetical protein
MAFQLILSRIGHHYGALPVLEGIDIAIDEG